MRWRLWLLMAPALALLLAIFAAPLLHYLWLSTQAQSVLTGLQPQPIGAQQWLRLWNDGRFWQDTWQTLRFSAASVSLEMLLGLAVALLLNQPLRGRGVLRQPRAITVVGMAQGKRLMVRKTPRPRSG